MKFDLKSKDVPASYYGKGDKFFWSFRAAVEIEWHRPNFPATLFAVASITDLTGRRGNSSSGDRS